MTRQDAERLIAQLYGAPGTDSQTPMGESLMMRLLESNGLHVLTDDAVITLAGLHRDKERHEKTRKARA